MRVGPVWIIPDKGGPTLETEIQSLELTIDAGRCSTMILPNAVLTCIRVDPSMATPEDYPIHGSIRQTTYVGPTTKLLSNHPKNGPTDNGPMTV